ncbi:TetR family transcriptional regulator C-terminal domain-containing protein [Clostridium sp. WILCCON 0269]|uniref:TetR family transcriptional regulator C-terminal domain-containing protein n=1 Tax=Candidatus Clostridium eludens TaxID=3381663 RepID=A0ABW8SIQ5_9CLOT
MFLEQQELLLETFLHLIIEGQESGEIVKEDPEKLTYTLIACLDGLSKFALLHSEKYKQLFTDASIIMRIIKS